MELSRAFPKIKSVIKSAKNLKNESRKIPNKKAEILTEHGL